MRVQSPMHQDNPSYAATPAGERRIDLSSVYPDYYPSLQPLSNGGPRIGKHNQELGICQVAKASACSLPKLQSQVHGTASTEGPQAPHYIEFGGKEEQGKHWQQLG